MRACFSLSSQSVAMDPANVQGSGAQQKMRSLGPPRYDGADGNPLYDTNGVGHYGQSFLTFLQKHRVVLLL